MRTPLGIANRLDQLYADPKFSWLSGYDGSIGFLLAGTAGSELRSDSGFLTILLGGNGDDTLKGSAHARTILVGGDGNDTFVVRRSDHEIVDSQGQDTLIVVTELAQEIARSANAVVALDGAIAPEGADFADISYLAPAGIENLTAIVWQHSSTASFDLLGNAENNRLIGDSFANRLAAGGGDDRLFGHGGNDMLFGGDGADEISGGGGNDRIWGDAGDDRLYGGDGDDIVEGGDGNDWLKGNAGDDRLLGGDGDDTLTAAVGTDRLEGGNGNDLFLIGHRAETVELEGGAGADLFVIQPRPGDLVLHFDDFVIAEDRLDLSGWIGTASADSLELNPLDDGVWIAAPGRTLTLHAPVDLMAILDIETLSPPVVA